MQYRKKPVVIDACQLPSARADSSAWGAWNDWCIEAGFRGKHRHEVGGYSISIPTLEGEMTARPGDWIIKGVAEEFYPCKPDIFEATYEPVT